MPLYDWENGVYHPHKNVYDWENGVYHPHQKVYDWENGVYHPHWSSERVLLDNANSGDDTGGWVYGRNYIDNPGGLYQNGYKNEYGVVCEVSCGAYSYLNKSLWTANPINLSEYSSMRVWVDMDISYNDPGYNAARGYGIVANPTQTYSFSAPDNDNWVNWQTAYQWRKYVGHMTGTDGTTWDDIAAGPSMKEYSVDISNWNGWHYIGVIGACAYSNHIRVRFRRIVFS